MSDSFVDLLDHLEGVRRRGDDRADARCPAHDDRKASLSVARGDGGRVLVTCHAGCALHDVVSAAGVSMSSMFGEPEMVAEYPYTDEHGAVLYYAERWAPKDFRVRMANGTRRWPTPEQRVLYNLGAVLWARQFNHPIFIVEGEKDVETMRSLRFAATTTLGGAGKPWQPQYTSALDGIDVVIMADRDAAGLKWARSISRLLEEADTTRSVTIRVPRPKECKDVTDLIEAGYTITDTDILADTMGEVALAKDYTPSTVSWLWKPRIPEHMFTLLEGDPGTGKSTLISELIGCLTTGRPLPGSKSGQPPVMVAMLADEDNWSMVVTPKLVAAGADLNRVLHFKGIRDGEFLAPYSLGDLATLRHDLNKTNADVLVIDPIMAYLGSTAVDSYRDHHVRSVLGPLVQMAEEDRVTIIAVRHFTKAEGGKAIHKGGGSIGFTGQARSILQTGKHPERDDRIVLAVAKNNLAPLAPSLSYQLVSQPDVMPHVVWDDMPAPYTAQDLVGTTERQATTPTKRYAEEFLYDLLSDGPKPWKEIASEGRAAGHAEHTLRDVRDQVAHPIRSTGGNRATLWSGGAKAELRLVGDDDDLSADAIEARIKAKKSAHLPPTSPLSPLGDIDPASASENGTVSGPKTRGHTDHTPSSHLPSDDDLAVVPSLPASAVSGQVERQDAIKDPFSGATVCNVCGTSASIVIDEEHGARCRHHDPLIWEGS